MKENVFDVLMYLFENYMDEGPEFNPDQERLTAELAEAGFARGEIGKAFSWLEGLSELRDRPGTPDDGGRQCHPPLFGAGASPAEYRVPRIFAADGGLRRTHPGHP